MAIIKPEPGRLMRCAIYTRKSVAAGLEKPLNSLQTQRAVCEAYIKSQAHRNWVELPQAYDDGGFSGGTLVRPALQRLVNDIESGQVDIVVIYKVDRLSRSLTDFVKLIELLDQYGTSFVSVTQTFDTSDSMGRLVLNILLTFAQFERELASERIRDRCALRRKMGLFPGGMPPIGYLVRRGGKLVPDPDRADAVRDLFLDFPAMSANRLGQRLEQRDFKTLAFGCRHGNRNRPQKFPSGNILKILRNPLYAGYFEHRGELQLSQIEPLVSLEHWQLVQEVIRTRHPCKRDPVSNFLLGILHDECGRRLKIAKGTGGTKKARYYVSEAAGWARGHGVRRVHVRADDVEELSIVTIGAFLTDRIKLKEAVLSLGAYSEETAKLLKRGQLAARRLALFSREEIRELFLALVPRAEVNRDRLQLLICCYELCRFLAWDGEGLFKREAIRPKGSDRFRMLYAPSNLICTRPEFALPVKRRAASGGLPDDELIKALSQGSKLKQFMLDNRSLSIAQLAQEKRMGSKLFTRYVRLTYLAPDIQAAIVDGMQPAQLTRNKLLFGPQPLDWDQQRRLYGFASLTA